MAPTISAVKAADDGYHSIDVTASGLVGDSWSLDINVSATDPADSDRGWIRVGMYDAADTTIRVTPIASGTKYYFRARQHAVGRITSDPSTHVTATTDTLPAPTGLVEELVSRTDASMTWTTGISGYDIEIEVTQGATIILSDVLAASSFYDPVR